MYLITNCVGERLRLNSLKEYRPCVDGDGNVIQNYYVAADGTVVSTKRRTVHVMTPAHSDGDLYVPLRINGKTRIVWVRRLVAHAWIGPAPSPDHHVLHVDGNKANNSVTNLRWATQKEIIHHTGLRNGSVLSGEQVETIRDLRTEGKTFNEIADHVGFSTTSVAAVIRGRSRFEGNGIEPSWTHGVRSSKLCADDVKLIREMYASGGFTQKQLADIFGIHHSAVSYIVREKRWKQVA